MSLILAVWTNERLEGVDQDLIISTLVKFAILFKVMDAEGAMGPHVREVVDKDLKGLNILDIIDLYVAHRPEEL